MSLFNWLDQVDCAETSFMALKVAIFVGFLMTFVTTKEEYENNLFFLHNVHARQFLTVFVLFFVTILRHFF
jgi:hypothetical protein